MERSVSARIALLEAAVKAADEMRANRMQQWRLTHARPDDVPFDVLAYDAARKKLEE